jgi:hypothetical protein
LEAKNLNHCTRTSDQKELHGALESLSEILSNPTALKDLEQKADWLLTTDHGMKVLQNFPTLTECISEQLSDADSHFEELHGYASPQYTEPKVVKRITLSLSQIYLLNSLASKK